MPRSSTRPRPVLVPSTWTALAHAVLSESAGTTEKLAAANTLARLVIEQDAGR